MSNLFETVRALAARGYSHVEESWDGWDGYGPRWAVTPIAEWLAAGGPVRPDQRSADWTVNPPAPDGSVTLTAPAVDGYLVVTRRDGVRLVNMTPHAVTLLSADDAPLLTLGGHPEPARCAVRRERVDTLPLPGHPDSGVPVYASVLGAPEGLPAPEAGTRYVVSRVVADAAPDRPDLLVPDDLVRDAAGRIVGCRAFARCCPVTTAVAGVAS